MLTADVAQHLNLPVESLQMDFKTLDEKVLNLSEPLFKFQIEPTRLRNLGRIEWDVTLISDNGNKKVDITANARDLADRSDSDQAAGIQPAHPGRGRDRKAQS